MRMNGSLYHLSVHSTSLPQLSTMVTFEQVPLVGAHISAGVHPGTEALVEVTIPIMSSMIYRTGACHYTLRPHVTHFQVLRLLDPARVNTMLSTALIMAAMSPPSNHGTITHHTLSQRSSLHRTSQSPRLRAPAAAVLLSIEAVSLHRKYPGIVGRVLPHAYRRENRRLILKPLFPPL